MLCEIGSRRPSSAFVLILRNLLSVLACVLLLGIASPLWAQVTTTQPAVNFSVWVAVGAATGSTQTLTFSVPSGTTLGGVSALTLGAPGLDYTVVGAGTTCANATTATTCTVEVKFLPLAPGTRLGAVVLVDQSTPPKTLITVPLSGVGTGPSVAFSPGTITTVAGNGAGGYFNDGGLATLAELDNPHGVALDGAGNFYIADTVSNRIRMVTPGGIISTYAGTGAAGASGDNGAATSAELDAPYGVAVDGAGNLYIADQLNNRIRMVTPTGTITTVAGGGSGACLPVIATDTLGDGCPAIDAVLNRPSGVVVDGGGNLYIADTYNQRIRMVTPATVTIPGTITTVAGNGTQGPLGDGGLATSAQLDYPFGVAIDGSGNIYIADLDNSRIREVTGGIINTAAGDGTSGFSGDGGPATSAQLFYPTGVAVDGVGNLYIVDTANQLIRMVAGGIINTVAGNRTSGFLGDSGPATSAELNTPSGIAVNGVGDLYIADEGNNRIRQVDVSDLPPPLLSFASTDVGQASASQDLAVLNLGNTLLTISQISIAPNFTLGGSDTSCSTTSQLLNPAFSCVLGVEFNPTVGTTVTGSVILTDNALNAASAAQTIVLQGTGIPPAATTTKLTAAPASVALGGTTTLTASVSSTTPGTITGTVTFSVGSATLGTAPVSGGLATFNVAASAANGFVAGSNKITAAYGGETVSYAASSGSTTLTISGVAAATTTTVTFSANPVALNGAVNLTATVGSATAGTITGTVTFMVGTATLETVALSGGQATLPVPVYTSKGFIGGPNTITATYSGNATYQTSTNSAPLTVTGVANPTTTTLAASPASLMLGGTTTLTASVGSATAGTITGTVTFMMGTTTLGTAALSGGLATLSDATVIAPNGFYVGTDTVTAIYSGNTNYAGSTTPGSTPGSTPLTVLSPPVTTTTLTAAPASVILGGTTELVAAVSSTTNGTITGTVTFMAGLTTLGTATVSRGWAKLSGVTAIAANGLSVGTDTITASYGGSASYGASTGSGTLTVQAATTTTLTPAPYVVTLSGTMELVAAVTSTTAGTIAGTVTFMVNNTTLGTAAVVGGVATLPSLQVSAANGFSTGKNVITASYGGDATYGISTGSAAVSVTGSAVTTTSLTAVPAVVTLAGTTELVASVTSTTTGTVTGSVTFSIGSTTLGTVAVSGGLATLPNVAVSAANGFLLGNNTITSSYAGNSDYAASIASTTLAVTGSAATATTLTAAPASVAPGGTTALTASVSSAIPGTLTGSVTFAMGGTTLGTAPVSGGLATLNAVVSTANGFSVGSDSLTATYTGNANYASSSGGTTLAVSGPAVTTTSLTAAPASLTLGGTTPLELVAAVSSTTVGTITGTVTFAVGGTPLGTATISGGFATLTHVTVSAATGFIAGTDTITATYGGSSNYAPSTGSTPLTALAATTTTLTAAPASATFGGTTELVAAVSSTAGGSIAGIVTFSMGSTTLGAATLSGGLATLSNVAVNVGGFIAGPNAITASYAGNSNYAASIASTTLVVTGSAVTATTLAAAPATVAPGGTTTLTAAVSSTAGGTITGTVTFSRGGIALGAAPVTSGLATLANVAVSAANGFSVGSDTITATYGGNANYAISNGSTTLTVAGPAVTTTTLTAAPPSLILGGTTELVAAVSSTASGTITGTVTFSIGSKTLGTAAISGGWATLSNVTVNAANGFIAGTDTITASYAGGASFAASTGSTALTALATSTTTLTAVPASMTLGAPTELVASVSSTTAGTITGTVTFSMGSTTLGTATLSGGLATLSNVAVSAANGFIVGTDKITASYGGAASFAASSGSTTLTVAPAPVLPSYTLTVSTNTVTIVGNKASVTLNLTSDNYAGTVGFSATSSGTALIATAPSVTLTSDGSGSSTLTISLAPSAAKHAPARPWKSGGAIMVCVVLLGTPFGQRRKRAIAVLLTALTISLAGLLMACGGGSSNPSSTPAATPPTYTITVTPTGTGTVTNPAPISITATIS